MRTGPTARKRDITDVNRVMSSYQKQIKALEAERDALKDALEEIARQHTEEERETYEEEEGDIEGAYDMAIRRARAALAEPARKTDKESR